MKTNFIFFLLLTIVFGCSQSDNRNNDSREIDITAEFINVVANKTYGPKRESYSFQEDGRVKWKTEAYVGFEQGDTLFNGKKAHTRIYVSCNARIESKITSVVSRKNSVGEQEYIVKFATEKTELDPYSPIFRYETGDFKPRNLEEATEEQRRAGIEICAGYAKKGFQAEEQRVGANYGISSWGRLLKSFDSTKLRRGDYSGDEFNSTVYSYYLARGQELDMTSKFLNDFSGSWTQEEHHGKPRLIVDKFDKKIVLTNLDYTRCGKISISASIKSATVDSERKPVINFDETGLDVTLPSNCDKKPNIPTSLPFEVRSANSDDDVLVFGLGDYEAYYMKRTH